MLAGRGGSILRNARNWLLRGLRRQNIYVFRSPPRGLDLLRDLSGTFGAHRFEMIFDVGANVGQTTAQLLIAFPKAHVLAFEPSEALYNNLAGRFSGETRVKCERLALGSSVGEASLLHTDEPTMYHIAATGRSPLGEGAIKGSEPVMVTTIDDYCAQRGMRTIDLLKIDTEGHDLEVLLGSSAMLSDSGIGCVQCECGLNPENNFHCRLEDVKAYLEAREYRLFGFYEQVPEWSTSEPHLRRVDAVFVSPRLIADQRRSELAGA